jgi:hypothetical protein
MLRDEPVHHLTMSGESPKGPNLVLAHEARIASHVSSKDRCQPSLDPVLSTRHGPKTPIERTV